MIRLFDGDTEAEVGQITDVQLEQLVENLVEETIDEYSWNINATALSSLEGNGADPDLIAMLRRALGNRGSMELRYEPD
jgi:processive 1,2-diacylglycerol beta-glucosyltransferase